MRIPRFSSPKHIETAPRSNAAKAGAEGAAKATSKKVPLAADQVERSAAGTTELYGRNVTKRTAVPAKNPLQAEHKLLLQNNSPLGIANKFPDALRDPALLSMIEKQYGTETAIAAVKHAIGQKKLEIPKLQA